MWPGILEGIEGGAWLIVGIRGAQDALVSGADNCQVQTTRGIVWTQRAYDELKELCRAENAAYGEMFRARQACKDIWTCDDLLQQLRAAANKTCDDARRAWEMRTYWSNYDCGAATSIIDVNVAIYINNDLKWLSDAINEDDAAFATIMDAFRSRQCCTKVGPVRPVHTNV